MDRPRRSIVTGGAGFIGSHVVEALLRRGDQVVVVDNLQATGNIRNILAVQDALGGPSSEASQRLVFRQSDIADFREYLAADVVFHLAAVGSIPRSIVDPKATHWSNVHGFFTVIHRAGRAKVPRFVYASSSSVYAGIHEPIRRESMHLRPPQNPYAASKQINETYAAAFNAAWGLRCIGLRLFNVYGPRQDSLGDYAAVIPKWIRNTVDQKPIPFRAPGSQVRDYTYVVDVARAFLLAAEAPDPCPIYNVGSRVGTDLLELSSEVWAACGDSVPLENLPARPGDVSSSIANCDRAELGLGWRPEVSLDEGLRATVKAMVG